MGFTCTLNLRRLCANSLHWLTVLFFELCEAYRFASPKSWLLPHPCNLMPTIVPERWWLASLPLLLLLTPFAHSALLFPAAFLIWLDYPLKLDFRKASLTRQAVRNHPLVSHCTLPLDLAGPSSNCAGFDFFCLSHHTGSCVATLK